MGRLRIASVSFINARPLTFGFESAPYRDLVEMSYEIPSAIPDLLREGRVDVGLIPSIAWTDLPGAVLLPQICIGARRRARSVLLVSRVPIDRVRRIALDSASRTSAALLRILMADRGRHDIAYDVRPAPLRTMLQDHDAALIIGDPALTADRFGLEVMDLGTAWFEATGLPFVFAVWAARPGVPLPDGARWFLESRRLGLASIPAIAREAAPVLCLPADEIEMYLTGDLHYLLGSAELAALDLFLRRAHELGLASQHRPPVFLDPPPFEAVPSAPVPAPAGVQP